ncbi:ABC transporter substrate-binding protein [Streptomyces zagrosensis]|uniref:Peptide/nickel transport system substrate-binding protein n=1 Tax=Streptomyces zagrosensis TaxID=1042984 RepID=A0A7W9QCJ8_9ACTN|nr:ABC transporter substrate-binding protein [Streptomyces zagrosensis]MBB5936702.1 peptide/nickel transport system substrate-binding protein [Streptomyces zagrosensis]
MSVDGVIRGPASRTRRCATLFAAGVLLPLPWLTGCSSGGDKDAAAAPAAHDVADASRADLSGRGTVRWAIDARPTTLNVFQAAADAGTERVAGAVLPTLFTLDKQGRAQRNADYLKSAEITDRDPQQVVVYRLNPKAVWSDGRAVGVADFIAQWRALRGKNTAYWTARNAGYERIKQVSPGAEPGEVKVTFRRPYADWRALFSPLYPKDVMASPKAFNEGVRDRLPLSAGPFMSSATDTERGSSRDDGKRGPERYDERRERGQRPGARTGTARTGTAEHRAARAPSSRLSRLSLVRNPRWWGEPARLDKLVFTPVPRAERTAALAAGTLDVAEIDAATAERIEEAGGAKEAGGAENARRPAGGPPPGNGPNGAVGAAPLLGGSAATMTDAASALRSWVIEYGPKDARDRALRAMEVERAAAVRRAVENRALSAFTVRRSLEPAYTQLALNGTSGPLADERVRRAIARAIDREELADTVLGSLDLSAKPLGSHLTMAGQRGYKDNSGVIGAQDNEAAQSLLADAGWQPGAGAAPPKSTDAKPDAKPDAGRDSEAGARSDAGTDSKPGARSDARTDSKPDAAQDAAEEAGRAGEQDQPERDRPEGRSAARNGVNQHGSDRDTGRSAARDGSAREGTTRSGTVPGGAPVRVKDGDPLLLRFVLPAGPGTEQVREVGERIARMLGTIGIQTDITQVTDKRYFKDHVAKGDYDLALYSWPATAFPATDARPIFAKPRPAADGSLLVEQNYTRVGTDQIDQLFDQASTELDEDAARKLIQRADARIWAAAGSLPLYQRPQLVAVRSGVANVGAFGFSTPRYQDIGYEKSEDAKAGAAQ